MLISQFDKFNTCTMLQTQETYIYELQRIRYYCLFTKKFYRLIKPECIAKGENILGVNYKNKDEQVPK